MTDPDRLREQEIARGHRKCDPRFCATRHLLDRLEAAEKERDEAYAKCAAFAEAKFARIHTYASENSDRYIAMRDAGEAIARGIRALQTTGARQQETP